MAGLAREKRVCRDIEVLCGFNLILVIKLLRESLETMCGKSVYLFIIWFSWFHFPFLYVYEIFLRSNRNVTVIFVVGGYGRVRLPYKSLTAFHYICISGKQRVYRRHLMVHVLSMLYPSLLSLSSSSMIGHQIK